MAALIEGDWFDQRVRDRINDAVREQGLPAPLPARRTWRRRVFARSDCLIRARPTQRTPI